MIFYFLFCVLALRFGFVDFDTEENCKVGKDAIEDCEIDGNKVCVAYARRKGAKPPAGANKSPQTPPAKKPAGQKKKGGVKGIKGNFDGLRGLNELVSSALTVGMFSMFLSTYVQFFKKHSFLFFFVGKKSVAKKPQKAVKKAVK